MKKIIMTRGLPASGKSTWAKKQIENNPHTHTRVNKDDLRAMMHNSKWSQEKEEIIMSARDVIVTSALSYSDVVIVDDTNYHPEHEKNLRHIADMMGAEFEIKDFDKRPELCIKHDLLRQHSVGRDVIMKMYNKYVKKDIQKYVAPEGVPKAIIVDIDGTLAHMDGRSPYDYSKVMTDTCDNKIAKLVDLYFNADFHVIIVSGRANDKHENSDIKTITSAGLDMHQIPFNEIHLREEGDVRKDVAVKQEIFNEHIRDNYQVEIVLDDRNQTVEGGRELGLKCLQVQEGNF